MSSDTSGGRKTLKPKKAIKMLSALAQETRLNVFRLLIKEDAKGLPAGTIAEILQVPSATLSFHLTQMTNAGLLKSSKEGRVIRYAAKHKSIKNLMAFLNDGAYKKSKKITPSLQISDADDSND